MYLHRALRYISSKADCLIRQVILAKAPANSSNMWSAILRLCGSLLLKMWHLGGPKGKKTEIIGKP